MQYLYEVNIPDDEMEDKSTAHIILDNILFSVFREFTSIPFNSCPQKMWLVDDDRRSNEGDESC